LYNPFDQVIRVILCGVMALIFAKFWAIRGTTPSPLVKALMLFVLSDSITVAWYLIGSLGPLSIEQLFVANGHWAQFPRLLAATNLLRVMNQR
jgi:hypothetical protein